MDSICGVNGEIGRARECYERAVEKFADDDEDCESLFVAFAEFEEKCKEIERERGLFISMLLTIYQRDGLMICIGSLLLSKISMVTGKELRMPLWGRKDSSMRMKYGRIL